MTAEAIITGGDIDAALADVSEREAHAYAKALRKRATTQDRSDPWELLARVFDMHFSPHDAEEPFSPMVIFKDGRRSMKPSDLTDEQLDALKSSLEGATDPEVRARLGDVLWITRKDADAARAAVEGYLQSGIRLENPDHWVAGMECYERAARLARSLGKNNPLFAQVLSHIEARVHFYAGKDPLFFTERCLCLLHEFQYGDAGALAKYAIAAAEHSLSESYFDRARAYYEIAAKLLMRAGQQDLAGQIKTAFADTFVQEAEQREQEGSHLAAHHFWEKAIQAYRLAAGGQKKVAELQKRLNNAGEKARGEMQSVSVEMDISEGVAEAQGAMTGLSRNDAFCALSRIINTVDPGKLRERVLKHFQESAMLHTLFPVTIFDQRGRAVDRQPGLHSHDPNEMEERLKGVMMQEANIERGVNIAAYIGPAMEKLLEEHEIGMAEIEELLRDSAFIPANRRTFFVRGITAGFQKDFLLALHLLIPQLEYALRKLLHDHGVIAASIDSEGIEEDWAMGRIMAQEELKKILSPSLVYELKSLLIEKGGPNMRNLALHGMMEEEAFDSPMAIYFWWIMLRLCVTQTSVLADFIARCLASDSNPQEKT